MLPRLFSIRPTPWQLILFCALGFLPAPLLHAQARPFAHPDRIRYDGQCITIDGKDMVIYSGSFHYFRCPKPLWAQRFAAIREAGFNTVETYVAWNMHEVQAPSGLDDFSKIDLKDVDEWLTMAEQAGLYVIIRPGPYICAEWERGGFPGWLANFKPEHPLRQQGWLRSDDPAFVAWSKHWYKAVCPVLAPHQITRKKRGDRGIILFQLENEYDWSAFPDPVKTTCVKALAEEAMADGIDVPLFTCWTHLVQVSTDPVLRHVFDTCNFYPGYSVDDVKGVVEGLRRSQPDVPDMTTELQGGWYTPVAGGKQPIMPDVDRCEGAYGPAQIQNLTLFVWANGQTLTNYYMLFGGTNLGDKAAWGVSTCYDYSAPIRECGGLGEKYQRVAGMGQFIREHGAQLARAVPVGVDVKAGSEDVDVVERRAVDGSRFLFIRTNQHDAPRSGQAVVHEKDGATLSFAYALEPFGAKVLYLPNGAKDASEGKWLPELAPVPPSIAVPDPIQITDIRSQVDPGPTQWKKMEPGQRLNNVGVYDSRFVYYRSTLRASPDDLNAVRALRVGVSSGDDAIASLNGKSALYTSDVHSLLHEGANDVLILFENQGYSSSGRDMEKLAGVSGVHLLKAAGGDDVITGWKMHLLANHVDDPPAPALELPGPWTDVPKMDAQQLTPAQAAVFVTHVQIAPEQIQARKTALRVEHMDDHGWVFVNGKKVGEGHSWSESYTLNAAGALHPGDNLIAVVIQNDDNGGGLGGMSWAQEDADSGQAFEWSDQPAGVVGNWSAPELDDSGWSHSPSTNTPALLNWHRLSFELPDEKPGQWVPWLIRLQASGNGFIYLNGHAIGRYAQNGGQHDYFLPDCWLVHGAGHKNVVTLCLRPLEKPTGVQSAQAMPYAVYARKR